MGMTRNDIPMVKYRKWGMRPKMENHDCLSADVNEDVARERPKKKHNKPIRFLT